MSLEITGKIIKVLPEQTGAGKNGNWVKQEFILETTEQYPKKVCCSAWGDKVDTLKSFSLNDMVKVAINIESREYNERWYTDVRAWKIDALGNEKPESKPAKKETLKDDDVTTFNSEEGDDLPF